MCCSHGIRILNGRFTGDTQGHLTFYSNNGSSCVDYALASMALLNSIKYFSVADPDNCLSDHCLIRFGIRCKFEETLENTQRLSPLYDKFVWSEDSRTLYPLTLLDEVMQNLHSQFLTHSFRPSLQGVEEAVSGLTQLLVQPGKRCLKLINRSKPKKVKIRKGKLGFDLDCRRLRQEVRRLGRMLRRNHYDRDLRL